MLAIETCMAADPVQQLMLVSVAENIDQGFDDICAKYHAYIQRCGSLT